MELWHTFLDALGADVGEASVKKWLRPIRVFATKEGEWELYLGDSFPTLWFEQHVRPFAKARLRDREGKPIQLTLKKRAERGEKEELAQTLSSLERPQKEPLALKKERGEKLQIYADATPSDLPAKSVVEHEGNRLAWRALQELMLFPERFVQNGFHPLYIYGPSGTGKSLLAGCAVEELLKKGFKVLYVRGETFTHHVVQAIRLGLMQQFRRFYRGVDLLVFDGIEVLSHKASTQEEFFHTFNSLQLSGKAIVLLASSAPKDLKGIEPRLISRFEWGLMAPLEQPNSADRLLIFKKHLERLGTPLSNTQQKVMLDSFGSSPGELIKASVQLSLLLHRKKKQLPELSSNELLELLRDLTEEKRSKELTYEKIISLVGDHFGITSRDILGKGQRREFSLPRQVAMYLCRKRLQMPFLKIARLFERDHSTVMASCKRIQSHLLEGTTALGHDLSILEQKL